MANFDNSAQMGKQMFFNYIQERMEERQITQYRLAQLTGVPESVLSKNFTGHSEMSVLTFLKILGALEIRPFLIPAELDKTEMQRIFFS